MKTRARLRGLPLLGGATLLALALPFRALADCTLTNLGITPLCDLGAGTYRGQQGGLYRGGVNQRPSAHEAAGINIATTQIKPRDAAGNVDTNNGKIGLLSIGLSNTTQEWATRGNHFTAQATADPSLNPRVVIVDGAQGGKDAHSWADPNNAAWTTLQTRLSNAGVTSNQVQAVWLKLAIAYPTETFPAHAQTLRAKLREVLTVAKQKLPNLAVVYLSSRTRAYVSAASGANPETFAYEGGFAVKWLIEDQINNGLLNYDPARGPVVAPWIAWGAYLWTDGEQPRSDGLTWSCTDVVSDFYHPSASGCEKVGRQLLSFFKTDPTTRPWFLKQTVSGTPPACAPTASVTNGVAPFGVNFSANASDPDGTVADFRWNFDDGTSSASANPVKTFRVPGSYQVRLTVTDNAGNTATSTVPVTVTSGSGVAALAVTTAASLPAGTAGMGYTVSFAATGGTPPYTWSLSSGRLPGGLILSPAGALSGTPAASGAFNFTVRVTDTAGNTASQAFALTVSASSLQSWKRYLGMDTSRGLGLDAWRQTIRGSYPLASGTASISNTIDPVKLDEVLAGNDWVNLQDGYNYRQQEPVDAFFNAVRADQGAAWRSNCTQLAQAMVDGNVRNAASGHQAYWELGNEIYVGNAAQTIGTWVAANNLPYPHPNSPFNDNPSHDERFNDRGIIGYQVEYQIAIALEALIAVNATAPTAQKIRILSPASTNGSIGGGWINALLDYEIVGYEVERGANGNAFANLNKPLASSLAGRRLRDLVDIVNVHYILGPNATTLATVFDTWVTPTSRIQGVWHTEEGGINSANGGRGGLSAMNNFSRAMDLWTARGVSVPNARLILFAPNSGPAGTRGDDALDLLHAFMPADTTTLVRKPGLITASVAGLESYTFESGDGTRRALFILPGGSTTASLGSVTMQAGGWNWATVTGTARLWETNVVPVGSNVTVTRSGDSGSYTVSFPPATFTAQNSQALVIFLTGSSATPSSLSISTASLLPGGTAGATYAQTLAASGGTSPYTWSIFSGALPGGLTLDFAGVITGTPTASGSSSFSARVADATGATATRAFTLSISASGTSTPDGPWTVLADGSEGRTTTYRSASGETIAAYVRKPAGNGPFPLVLMVHGGGTSPSGTYALGRQMTPPTANFIAAGFVIFSMDFAAVAGNALAEDEWQLAASAIAAASRLPYVDPLRIAMVGQSHGGNLSCRAASHLDILAAIPAAPAGIDPLAAWRFQQNGGSISPNLQGLIDDAAAFYKVPIATLAANPSAYGYRDVTDDAPSVRYPLLLVSGLNDTSSPPDVMNDYGAALTAAGKYFETYYPANGPHGFVFSSPRIPETDEFTSRAIAFMGRYFSVADSDADGLPDGWELARFNSLAQGPTGDPDGDGQDNLAEYHAGTHPSAPTSTTPGRRRSVRSG